MDAAELAGDALCHIYQAELTSLTRPSTVLHVDSAGTAAVSREAAKTIQMSGLWCSNRLSRILSRSVHELHGRYSMQNIGARKG